MSLCENPRGTLYNRQRRIALRAGCRRWACKSCGRRKARRVAARATLIRPDYLLTLSLPRSAWATRENVAELQRRARWFLRYCQRHKIVTGYLWVREVGKPNDLCVCHASLQGCICGAGGHRHFLIRGGQNSRNRYGKIWMPYAQLQAAAKRCGLGTLDFRQINDSHGAARYVSKYLGKQLSTGPAPGLARSRRWATNEYYEEPKVEGWAWDPRVALVAVDKLDAAVVLSCCRVQLIS